MKTGLLIVDLQVGFKPSDRLCQRIEVEMLRHECVVMTRFVNTEDSLYRTVLNWHSDGGTLVLPVSENTVVLTKPGYGLSAEQVEILCAMGCDEWHLCGVSTDACVLACAYSLWDGGIKPVIREDLCESLLHQEAIRIATRQFGARTK